MLGLPTDTACYVHRLRQALGRGSCTTGIPSTARPTQKAKIAVGSLQLLCPLFLFLEKDKGCTILSLATTNKHGLFLKGGNLSVLIFLTGFVYQCFLMLTFSPLCTDIVLGMLLLLKGKEEVKEERYGVWSMRTEFGVFLRSYLPSPIRNCSNLSPFLTPVSCLGIRKKLILILRNGHLDNSMENIL